MKFQPFHRAAPVMAVFAALLLSACSSTYQQDGAAAPAAETSATAPGTASPKAAATSAQAVGDRAATKASAAGEPALAEGLKAYQAGQYRQAEAQLKAALKAGLATPADQANAHKHLAFVYCTSKRVTLCTAAFKNAKAADPAFALSKSEAGHPMWAKAYKNAMAPAPAPKKK